MLKMQCVSCLASTNVRGASAALHCFIPGTERGPIVPHTRDGCIVISISRSNVVSTLHSMRRVPVWLHSRAWDWRSDIGTMCTVLTRSGRWEAIAMWYHGDAEETRSPFSWRAEADAGESKGIVVNPPWTIIMYEIALKAACWARTSAALDTGNVVWVCSCVWIDVPGYRANTPRPVKWWGDSCDKICVKGNPHGSSSRGRSVSCFIWGWVLGVYGTFIEVTTPSWIVVVGKRDVDGA